MRFFVAVALLVTLSLAPGGAQTLTTIRISGPPIDAASQMFYAQEKGFFKEAGLGADIKTAINGAAVAAAVAGGSADIGNSNLVSLASAHERGLPFVCIAGANQFVAKQHQSALLVATASPFKAAKDLNGKTVVFLGLKNITEIGFNDWMDHNGGDYQSVKGIELPPPSIHDAIVSGRVDAGMSTDPELSRSLASGKVRVLSRPLESIGQNYLAGCWFTTRAWAQAHPDQVRGFRAAIAKSADWANAHQTESAKILETATGVAVAGNQSRILFADKLDPKAMQPLIDASAKYGALKSTFPASEIIF